MFQNILYVAMKNDYGDEKRALSYDYNHIYRSLIDNGYNCTFFDYMVHIKNHGHKSLQRDLIEMANQVKPDLVIFSLYTDQIEIETIRALSAKYKTFGLFFDDTWRRDFVVTYGGEMNYFTTTDPYGEHIYKRMSLKATALQFSYGFNPKYFSPDRSSFKSDISFVGSWSPSREWIYKELTKSGFKCDFYGHGWKNGLLSNEEMVNCFQKSKINLNLSNSVQNNISYLFSSARAFKSYFTGAKRGEQIKGRHTEINACGGFQISFYANGITNLYEIGKEIEIYQDLDDLKFKLNFYLENEDLRESIASAGLAKAQSYSYGDVMKKLFQRMKK